MASGVLQQQARCLDEHLQSLAIRAKSLNMVIMACFGGCAAFVPPYVFEAVYWSDLTIHAVSATYLDRVFIRVCLPISTKI